HARAAHGDHPESAALPELLQIVAQDAILRRRERLGVEEAGQVSIDAGRGVLRLRWSAATRRRQAARSRFPQQAEGHQRSSYRPRVAREMSGSLDPEKR